MPGPGAVELTVKCLGDEGQLLGGLSGWTWQEAAGIGLTCGVPVKGHADVHFRKDL